MRIKLIEEKKASRFSSPLLASVLGVITNVLTAQCQRQTKMDLDAKKYGSALLLKALGSEIQDAAAKMLILMVSTQLI